VFIAAALPFASSTPFALFNMAAVTMRQLGGVGSLSGARSARR
jgi:hypothetical protein